MAKTRYKPEELTQQSEPEVAVLPSEQPVSPFLDPSVAQAEPQGSELYNLGTVQQRAASTQGADMYMPSYLQAPRNYPTGAEGGATRPEGASPMLYPSQAETQPRVRARYKPEEALAIAEANRPKRYSPDQMLDVAAESMFDASQQPLPKELWKAATQRRAEMVKDGRLPMEFGQIDSLKDGIVWAANSIYGVGSYLVSAPIAAAVDFAKSPIESRRQMHATAAATIKRLSTEFGLQTYQDIFNLTHEPKYRVKETGQFVAVNKTGLPLMLPAASGGNNVISGDGIISPVTPEAGIRQFAKEGMTLIPTTEQDLEDYRYGQYLDRMGIGAQSIEDMKAKAPPELVAALVSGNWDSVEPNQAQTELALLAAQAAIPVGGSARTWGVGRKVAAGISKAAEKVEAVAGFPVDVDTALRAKFVKAVTSGTGADAVAQKTAMQAAIDAGKTTAKVGGAYGVAAGVSSFEGTPNEIKDLAWTAANLYSGYKGGMYVARQLRAASGFTKTVLKEVADPSRGLDAGARAAVAANPAVPQSVRKVLESPSRYRAMESTPARLAKNPELSPTSRAVFNKLSDYRFVQAARFTRDAAAGVPKGITLNAPFIAGALASDDPERAGQMIAAGGLFGAVGGAASRLTEANMRRGEEATSDIARMLVDIQGGNELRSGLGGEIMRNRVRPGTRFQDGERGFVMPEQEVASFLTEMEMAGADVAAFVQGKSFDELAQWAAYQGFFRDKVDLVPLNATDYKLNAEANGQNGSGAYFLQPSEGRRARIFVNADSRRTGLAPHEYGHAVLRGGALSPDQIDAVHADISGRYTPDMLKGMAGEYAASMVRAENARAGIDIEPSPAAIEAKVNELSQGSMVKGSADGLDWLREEIFAEEFRNANIDFSRARRNIPLGANPVSFMENLLGAQSRALHMAGIDIDPQTGKPMGRDQIFKENRVAAGDPVVMKNYEAYVKQWRQWIKDPTHEADPGVAVSKTGNVQDTANNPNVTWRDYGGGRMENEFGIKNPDGTVTPKDWNRDIKPTVRARQQAVREMSNRSKQVSSADDPTFGMRTQRDGRRVISGRYLPDSFFFVPQYKPFHSDIRKIVAADGAGETMQVRYYAKGKSKDVFKDGVNGVNAVNREAMHGNFVAKKDGTLMWGYLDMTQFRNRAMKAIADRNPALEPYNWDLKTMMDDLPTHLSDQASGRGGAVSVGQERANVLNGLIGIGTGPLVGSFGRGTAYKTIHLDSIDAVVPTGKQGGQFDVYRANRNAMPDDPKPPVDMTTDLTPDNNRMPSALPQSGMAMPDAAPVRTLDTDRLLREYEENQGYLGLSTMGMREGRPVKGGATETRRLLARNTEISRELDARGVKTEDVQLQRALAKRQTGQAMPDTGDRKAVQQEAKRLGLPATGTTKEIADLVGVAAKDPYTWTREEFDSIAPHLSIHQDIREGSDARVAQTMERGLSGGMVDSVGAWRGGRMTWSGGKMAGNNAYLFISGGLKYRKGNLNPWLDEGNMPIAHLRTRPGQTDIYKSLEQGRATGGTRGQAMPDVSDIDTTKFTVAYRGGPSGKGDFPGTFVSTSQEAASQYGDVRAVGVPRGLKVLSIDDDAALQLARQYEKKYPADAINDDLNAGESPTDLFMFPRPEWTKMLKQKGYQATQMGEDLFVFDGVKLSDKQAAAGRARGQAMPDVGEAGDQGVAMPKGTVTQLTNVARKALPRLPRGASNVPKVVVQVQRRGKPKMVKTIAGEKLVPGEMKKPKDIVVDGGDSKNWNGYTGEYRMPLPNIKLDKTKGVSWSKQDIYDVAQTDRARAQANAQQSVQAAAMAAADPLKFVDPVGYSEIMRASGVAGDILIPPSGLKLMLTDPAAFVGLLDGGFHGKRTVPGTRAAAMQGLDGVTEMRQLVGGQPSSFNTALHHFWGTLSKQLDVINQEAAWMRLMLDPEIIEAIDQSISGKFSMQVEDWEALVAKALDSTQGDFRGKGNNAKSNANSFYNALVYHNGRWDEVAALYANNNAIDMRAQFNALGHGKVGMKNKVQGFVGLSFGVKGSVLDRWRFVDLYLPDVMGLTGAATPEQYFKYVGESKVIPQDPIGIYKNYGTIENDSPAFSLALYNSLDSVAQVAINNSPELRNYLGAHADPGGLHWVTWNSIKNEAVGHSSLDITKNFVRKYGRNGTASDFAQFMRTAEGFVEGSNDAGQTIRLSLKDGVFNYLEQ